MTLVCKKFEIWRLLPIPCMKINCNQSPSASKHYNFQLNHNHAWNWQQQNLIFNCSGNYPEKICTIWIINNTLQLMLQHPHLANIIKQFILNWNYPLPPPPPVTIFMKSKKFSYLVLIAIHFTFYNCGNNQGNNQCLPIIKSIVLTIW